MALTKITPQMFDTSATAHDLNVDNGTFVVDGSASRVGIGTATPSTLLDVNGTATATTFVGALTGNVTGTIQTAAQTNITSVGTLTGLNISGNVGIGTSSPRSVSNYGVLAVNGSSGSIIDFEVGETLKTTLTHSSSQFEINVVPALPLVFKTSNTEALRIDSDGQLFVGDGSPQWPTGTVSNSAGRHMFHHDGVSMLILWDESTAAQGNAAELFLGGKPLLKQY